MTANALSLAPCIPNPGTFNALLNGKGLTPEGIQYVCDVANSDPQRKVGRRRRRNVILNVAMQRLKVTLQAESLSGEYLLLVDLDHRRDVLAVFDQPITVQVSIVDRIKRGRPSTYTADYLVITSDRVIAYEVKTDADFKELTEQRPTDWTITADGVPKYLPACEAYSKFGIEHVTVLTSRLNPIRADNLRLLSAARASRADQAPTRLERNLRKAVEEAGLVRMDELMERFEIQDATPILRLIDRQEIVADLDGQLLSQNQEVLLASDSDALVDAEMSNLACALKNRSEDDSHFLPAGRYAGYMAFQFLELQGLDGRRFLPKQRQGNSRPSKRTLRRWREKKRKAGGRLAEPGWKNCGPNDELRSPVHDAYIDSHIAAAKKDGNFGTIKSAYANYTAEFPKYAAEAGLANAAVISQATYYKRWHSQGEAQGAEERGGRRLQNALSPSQDPTKRTVIATRPFSVAHIDHCLCKIAVIVGTINGRIVAQRPWLTAMVDAYTGEFLGIWIGFKAPSRKACAMVIRDCARRHGRLPEMIVVDGGKEFDSAHFHLMLAALEIDRTERPPEDPRFGKEVERAFGAFKDRFLRGLPGYGIGIPKARQVSAAFKATKRAALTPETLLECFEKFIFQGYNTIPKGDEIHTPTELRIAAMQRLSCCGKVTAWDYKLLLVTSIESPAEGYTLWPGRGVHVYDRWYCSDRLLEFRGQKKEIEVRLEPFDRSVVYVHAGGEWFPCYSQEYVTNRASDPETVLMRTTASHDLRELINEIRLETDRRVAEIVSDQLQAIKQKQNGGSGPKQSEPETNVAESAGGDSANDLAVRARRSYATVEMLPFEEEPEPC